MKSKIILGTVQFGLNYGINNSSGKPSDKEVFEMLDTAFENGIEYLDTADAYGDAIQVIGKYHSQSNRRFKILSKFKGVKSGELKNQATKSLEALKIPAFEVYSFHSYKDFSENEPIVNELVSLKKSKLIRKSGISVYNNVEFEKAIQSDLIDIIQIPYNILDNNNIRGNLISQARKQKKDIHIRSAFLQGLFFMNELPEKLKPLERYILKIKEYCVNQNISMHELALSYAIFNPQIANVLIGVDNKAQLLANLNAIKNYSEAFAFIDQNIKVNEIELLNPVNWK